jgi:hypothetical protein
MDPTKPGAGVSRSRPVPDAHEAALAARVLRAVADAAARAGEAEVDITAALRVARLPVDGAQLQAALLALRDGGSVGNFVPLPDGGLRVTVRGDFKLASPPPAARRRRRPSSRWAGLESEIRRIS